jgi:hypothetical protein
VFRVLLIVAAGLVFIVAGYELNEQLSPYPDGISAVGTVTGVRAAESDGDMLYTAVVTFATQDGREVSIDASSSSNSRPELGTTAHVSYRPEVPENGRVIPDHNWASVLCYAVGGLVVLTGLAILAARLLAVARFLTKLGP